MAGCGCGVERRRMREELAELAHDQWSGWMQYLFSKGTFNNDGTWTMPAWAVDRWKKQMETSYSELSESEQESDRNEADKFLGVIKEMLTVGKYTIRRYHDSDYWIEEEGGEGMQVFEKNFIKLIDDFYKEEF